MAQCSKENVERIALNVSGMDSARRAIRRSRLTTLVVQYSAPRLHNHAAMRPNICNLCRSALFTQITIITKFTTEGVGQQASGHQIRKVK